MNFFKSEGGTTDQHSKKVVVNENDYDKLTLGQDTVNQLQESWNAYDGFLAQQLEEVDPQMGQFDVQYDGPLMIRASLHLNRPG